MSGFLSLMWAAVAGLCAVGFGVVTGIFHPEEKVNGLWLVVAAACFYVLAYRFYGQFLARRVFELDNRRITPAHRLNDGANFHPTNRWVLFGHHFAAIAGAGPLLGRSWLRSSGICQASCGWSSARCWPERSRTSSFSSRRCAATAGRCHRSLGMRSGR